MGSIIDFVTVHFPQTLNRLYITNPHLSLYASWKIIEKFIIAESREKIKILRPSGFYQILDRINEDALLQKYGGKCEALKSYFPPKNYNFNHEDHHLDQSLYYSVRSMRSIDENHGGLDHDDTKLTHKSNIDFGFNRKNLEMEVIAESHRSKYSEFHDYVDYKSEFPKGDGACCKCQIY